MSYRVIQWATGGVGRAAMEGVLAHPELELAGAWVHSPDKVGADVGDLCGMDPVGVAATCLLYTSPSPRDRQKSRMPSSA